MALRNHQVADELLDVFFENTNEILSELSLKVENDQLKLYRLRCFVGKSIRYALLNKAAVLLCFKQQQQPLNQSAGEIATVIIKRHFDLFVKLVEKEYLKIPQSAEFRLRMNLCYNAGFGLMNQLLVYDKLKTTARDENTYTIKRLTDHICGVLEKDVSVYKLK